MINNPLTVYCPLTTFSGEQYPTELFPVTYGS